METVKFGRKKFSFTKGKPVLTSIAVTEKPVSGEDEKAFTHRLMKKYKNQHGTMEIVFKNGHPNYALVTFSKVINGVD